MYTTDEYNIYEDAIFPDTAYEVVKKEETSKVYTIDEYNIYEDTILPITAYTCCVESRHMIYESKRSYH